MTQSRPGKVVEAHLLQQVLQAMKVASRRQQRQGVMQELHNVAQSDPRHLTALALLQRHPRHNRKPCVLGANTSSAISLQVTVSIWLPTAIDCLLLLLLLPKPLGSYCSCCW
jgi:hypothetical protein